MKTRLSLFAFGIAAATASLAFTQAPQDTKQAPPAQKPKAAAPAAAQQAPQLPPGMTEADMIACTEAATPGEMHAFLAEVAGTWNGKNKMWMAPETEAIDCECVAVITPMMDGRYVKCEMSGDIPGMGPFSGLAISGYDNVAQKFQSTWIDNCSTTMMVGTGERSSDGTMLTWNYTYSCPITKKTTTMRQVETRTGKDSFNLVMFGIDPKSGKEFKTMEIAFTRAKDVHATGSTRE